MSDLPLGWRRVPLRDVCDPVAKVEPGGLGRAQFQYVDIGSIPGGEMRVSSPQMLPVEDAPARARQLLVAGDTVFSTVRPYLKKIAWIPPDLDGEIASTGFCVLRPRREVIHPRFLFYFATSDALLDQVLPLQRGVSYPAVRDADVLGSQIALPPLDEQVSIVNTLEDHLSHLDAGVRSLARAMDLVRRMRIATLSEMTVAVEHWTRTTIGGVAASVRNGVFVSRPKTDPVGVPILRIGSVRALHLDLSDLRYTAKTPDEFNVEKELLSGGDLLFTRYNGNPEYVAACAEVPALAHALTYPDKLVRVRLRPDAAHPAFVAMLASAGPTRAYLRSKVKTTAGQAGISGTDIKDAPIALPPLAEQVSIAEKFRDFLDVQEMCVASIRRVERRQAGLRRSLLHAAFMGDLSEVREVSRSV